MLAGDVLVEFLGLAAGLDREVERIAEKEVGLADVAGILLDDFFELLTEIELLHKWVIGVRGGR